MTLSEYLIEAVARRKAGKYRAMFPERYEDIGIDTVQDLMKLLGYKFVSFDNGGDMLSKKMRDFCRYGEGCYTFGDIKEDRYNKPAKWVKFCAPNSDCVFQLRVPDLPKIVSNNWWVDIYEGNRYKQYDLLPFEEFRDMVVKELGL